MCKSLKIRLAQKRPTSSDSLQPPPSRENRQEDYYYAWLYTWWRQNHLWTYYRDRRGTIIAMSIGETRPPPHLQLVAPEWSLSGSRYVHSHLFLAANELGRDSLPKKAAKSNKVGWEGWASQWVAIFGFEIISNDRPPLLFMMIWPMVVGVECYLPSSFGYCIFDYDDDDKRVSGCATCPRVVIWSNSGCWLAARECSSNKFLSAYVSLPRDHRIPFIVIEQLISAVS